MRILALLPAALATPLLLASCGLVHLPGSNDCPNAASPVDGGPPACPCDPPVKGDPCDLTFASEGMTCTYGTDPRPPCRQQFTCESGHWSESVNGIPGDCAPASECPSTPPKPGSKCENGPLECAFPDGTLCRCGTIWGSCAKPPSEKGCPAVVPNSGTPCSGDLFCQYDDPCSFGGVQCVEGVWLWSLGGGC